MNKMDQTLDQIKKNLIEIFVEIYNSEIKNIHEEYYFKEHIAWDSMNGLMIMIQIKERIYDEILPDDILESDSIRELAEKIFKKTK